MRRLLVVTLVAGLGTTAVAVADPDLPNIGAHRHFVDGPNGLVEVGPRVCDNPRVQQAFNQFHSNVHIPVPESPGPDHGAPGLHDQHGPEVTARACSFTAP